MAKIIVSLWCRTVFITDDSAFSDHLFVNLASDIARSISIKMELNQKSNIEGCRANSVA